MFTAWEYKLCLHGNYLNAFLMLSWLKRELISEFKKVKEHTVKEIKEIHFDLHTISFAEQVALGFDKNKEYHRFWEWPYCRCPRLDNEDIIGLPGKYHSMDCVVHGDIDDNEYGPIRLMNLK